MSATAIQTVPIRKRTLLSRLRAAAINAVLFSVSIVAGLLLMEFMVRMVAPQQLIVPQPELYRPDAGFGWRHQENAATTLNTGEGPVRFRTDGNGYRIPAGGAGNPSGTGQPLRILTLGDSFLEATAVEAEGTIPELLKTQLAGLSGRPVTVANAGVGGWDPNHYLLEVKRALSKEKYDLGIVFLYLGNDVVGEAVSSFPARQPAQIHRFRLPRSLAWKEWVNSSLYPFNDFLKTRSNLYLFAKTRLEVPLARLGLTAYYFPDVFSRAQSGSQRWDATTAICASIQREFAAHGARVIFTFLPTPYQVDPKLFETYIRSFKIEPESVDLDQPNTLLGTRFEQASLTAFDPLEPMRNKTAQGAQLYGLVDRHLNADGHRAVAEMLLPAVQAALGPIN